QPGAPAARPAEAGRLDPRPGRRRGRLAVFAGPHRQRRARARRRGRGHAPPDPRALRQPGEDPDARRLREPQRLGRHGCRPVRGRPATGEARMNLAWFDWVGLAGTLMILSAFFFLQSGRLDGNGIPYQLLNFFGAGGVLVSLLGTFNVSVFMLEAAWMAISVYGIWRTLALRRRPTG